jgi:hypothetical protein
LSAFFGGILTEKFLRAQDNKLFKAIFLELIKKFLDKE